MKRCKRRKPKLDKGQASEKLSSLKAMMTSKISGPKTKISMENKI